jgi:hypothetical protein
MSSYRKSMSEAYNGMYLVEGTIDKIKDIVSKKQHSKIDGVTVDLFTASAISQIYDKVNDANKKKMEKLPITKLAALAMKMMKNEYVPEELDLDESGHTDVASAMNNVKVATSALTKMSGELSKLSPEDALPSWWTNKVAVAVDKLDGMADYLDTQVEETDLDEAISGDQYYYVDPKGVVAAVGNKDAMRKMNMKQAKDGNKGGSFSQNLKKYKVGDKIKEEADLDEASKEGTIKIIKNKDGKFQIQKMTKGKFVDIGKPHNSAKEAEKFRSGQPDMFGEQLAEIAVGKEEVDLDEKVKVGDKVKVKLRRPGGTTVQDGKVIKIEKDSIRDGAGNKRDSIIVMHDFSRRPSRVAMTDIVKEESDLDEASARSDAKRSMSRDRDLGKKDDLDKDDFASDDDVKAASKNIMMQLRKASNRASRGVVFGDKKKVMVDPKIAQAVAAKYNTLRRPADKEKFQMQIAKSYKDMLSAIKESTVTESKFGIINKQLKGEK